MSISGFLRVSSVLYNLKLSSYSEKQYLKGSIAVKVPKFVLIPVQILNDDVTVCSPPRQFLHGGEVRESGPKITQPRNNPNQFAARNREGFFLDLGEITMLLIRCFCVIFLLNTLQDTQPFAWIQIYTHPVLYVICSVISAPIEPHISSILVLGCTLKWAILWTGSRSMRLHPSSTTTSETRFIAKSLKNKNTGCCTADNSLNKHNMRYTASMCVDAKILIFFSFYSNNKYSNFLNKMNISRSNKEPLLFFYLVGCSLIR